MTGAKAQVERLIHMARTVAIEGARALLHLDEPDTVDVYRTTSDHLRSDALGLKASLSGRRTCCRSRRP